MLQLTSWPQSHQKQIRFFCPAPEPDSNIHANVEYLILNQKIVLVATLGVSSLPWGAERTGRGGCGRSLFRKAGMQQRLAMVRDIGVILIVQGREIA
jgi:hypothetical protein